MIRVDVWVVGMLGGRVFRVLDHTGALDEHEHLRVLHLAQLRSASHLAPSGLDRFADGLRSDAHASAERAVGDARIDRFVADRL